MHKTRPARRVFLYKATQPKKRNSSPTPPPPKCVVILSNALKIPKANIILIIPAAKYQVTSARVKQINCNLTMAKQAGSKPASGNITQGDNK